MFFLYCKVVNFISSRGMFSFTYSCHSKVLTVYKKKKKNDREVRILDLKFKFNGFHSFFFFDLENKTCCFVSKLW